MTIKELREILFLIDNQNMTIKELREVLFNEKSQDLEINLSKRKIVINNKII